MNNTKYIPNIRLDNARIVKKNFSGKRYGDGKRTFGVIIPDEMVETLLNDGWNVKFFAAKPDDPTGHQPAWLPVKLKFGQFPPSIVLVTSRGKVQLDEYTVDQLDRTRIKYVKVVIRAFPYEGNGVIKPGVSAYVNAMVAVMDEERRPMDNPFMSEYNDIPELSYNNLMKEFKERQ